MMPKNRYAQNEEEIAKFWAKNEIFRKSIENRDEDNPYVFYDGPPFATGTPHYGHILSSVIKDLVPRYQTMKGKRVRRRWGWDCHGLPIETLVEKKLGISGKKQIEQKGVSLFNETARSMVLEYANSWEEMVDRIGRWVEFNNSYKTMDTTYMESIWWALKSLWEKDLIYEGRKVLMYCPRCETPVSNAEISMDNSYKDVTDETVTVKFKLKTGQEFGENRAIKGSVYILAWTTTPWTLPANVALAVGSGIEYTALRIRGESELYIIASKLVEKIFKDREIEVVYNDLTGEDLVGLKYEPLFEIKKVKESGQEAWYVVAADFVTTEDGTGVVHTAVIYGEDDFNLGQKVGLPQVPLLDSSGHYNSDAPEFLQNRFYKEAEKEIKDDLNSRNLLYSRAQYTHSYPFCWRCDSPLIYNAISAWFINIQKDKSRLIELNEKINWFPDNLKHGRFLNILETAPDWNISRNRYWATPLPFFKCGECGAVECIGSVKELKEKSTNFEKVYPQFEFDQNGLVQNTSKIDLHKPYIDDLKLKCECGSVKKRIDEVVDCWVESASMPFAEWHYPFENKEIFEKRYPGQFIGEYIAQTRAWFYYMHVIGSLLFDEISFENVVATGTILNEKGEKLSKSKKNFTDPNIIIDQYGTDALRFYLMNSVVMQADNLFFNEKDLRDIYNKVINLVYNIVKFYEIYSKGQGEKSLKLDKNDLGILDRWILSRLGKTIRNVTKYLDGYDSVKSTREIRDFIDDFSTWWLRRSRERFKQDKNALSVLAFTLKNLAKILAPFSPFVAEYVWQRVVSGEEESVHLSTWPKLEEFDIDEELEKEMKLAREIVELGHSVRAENSLRVRQPLSKIFWSSSFSSDEYEKIILEELNILEFCSEDKMSNSRIKKKSGNSDLFITIDTQIDERLARMGDLREFVRAIQDLRKKSGKKAGEKLDLLFDSESDKVVDLILNNSREISALADLSNITKAKNIEKASTVALSNGSVLIAISEDSKN